MARLRTAPVCGVRRTWAFILLLTLAYCLACSDNTRSSPQEGDVVADTSLPAPDTGAGDGADGEGDSVDVDVTGDGAPEDATAVPDSDAAPPRPGIDPDVTPESLVLPPREPTAVPPLPDGKVVRAASYNVYGLRWSDAATIGAFLAAFDLDILCLQECPSDEAAAIAEAAGFPHVAALGDKALLSRTPLADVVELPLSGGRSVLQATTEIDGVPFSLYGVHIGWNLGGTEQARALVDGPLAADPLPHVIMMGDFNDEHGSVQNTIIEEVMADAFTVAGVLPSDRVSWPATEFDGTEGSQLIDLVWFRRDFPAIVIAVDVVNVIPPLSDHKLIWAELLFPSDPTTPFDTDPFAAERDPWRGFPPEDERPPNRLQNPGAEEGLVGWNTAGSAQAVAERASQQPRSGEAFFTGFAPGHSPGRDRRSMGAQTVDLSAEAEAADAGRLALLVSGHLAIGYRTAEQDGVTSNILGPNDHVEIVVELFDSDGRPLLHASSGPRDTYVYKPWATILDAPPGTRSATLTWMGHSHPLRATGNDVAVDDLYLAPVERATAHRRVGGEGLANPGAESGDLTGWEARGFSVNPSLAAHGVTIFPPWAWSGGYYFYGGTPLYLPGTPAGPIELAQRVSLAPYETPQAEGRLAIRWGGRLRTYVGLTEAQLALEIMDVDGSLWGRVTAPPVAAPEWSPVEQLTRIPPGASAVRLVLSADIETVECGIFADDLYLRPEALEAPTIVR